MRRHFCARSSPPGAIGASRARRDRWHALWLLARGWSAAQVAEALGRDPHTVGAWLHAA